MMMLMMMQMQMMMMIGKWESISLSRTPGLQGTKNPDDDDVDDDDHHYDKEKYSDDYGE